MYGLAWGDGYLWASASDDGDVLRINPTTRTITRVHISGFPIGIVLAGGSIWVIDNANHKVLRLNPSTLNARTGKTAGAPIRIAPATGSNSHYAAAYAIAPAGATIWATSQTTNTISRIQAHP